jgi:ABC-type antimicrobial peptide transport system permease subunit
MASRKFGVLSYVSRNVRRHRLRSAITIIGISVSIVFFIVFASISQGLKDDIMAEIEEREAEIAKQRAGYITIMKLDVFQMDYLNSTELVQIETAVVDYCVQHNTTGEVYPITINFLSPTQEGSDEMYILFGVDPVKGVKYDFITFDANSVDIEGTFLLVDTERQIVLGNKVWEDNYPNNKVGDVITLETKSFMTGENIVIDNVTLVGILASNPVYDRFAAVPIEFLLRESGLYDPVTGEYLYFFSSIWIEDASRIDFDELESQLRDIADLGDRDMSDNENYINNIVQSHEREIERQEEQKRTINNWMLAVILLLSITTTVGISNTMLMSVTERRREIGTLKAVGITRARIYHIILSEALLLMALAIIIGSAVGSALAIFFDSQYEAEAGGLFFAPARITPVIIVYVAAISMAVGVLAAMYPAWRAANLNPTEALRYE